MPNHSAASAPITTATPSRIIGVLLPLLLDRSTMSSPAAAAAWRSISESDAETLADALADALGDALADALGDALADALGDALADALGDALADALGETLADALGDALADALGDALPSIAFAAAGTVSPVMIDTIKFPRCVP
jgi:hypothetical protein